MEEHERGRDAFASDEAYRLHCLRHSASHIMAQAVLALHPEAKLAIGPAIEDGFYYDIELARPISEDDLTAIEAEMKRIVKENQPFVRDEWSKEQAVAYFRERNQTYKLELIEGFGDPTVGVYKNASKEGGGEFIDLCKGPHVMRTGQAKHFKLLKVSGAYWRADANNAQLQRIYGTVWPTREELDKYLFRLEEAKKRDHRKLGRELELFMFHDWASGSPFWLPKGEIIYNLLSVRMRELLGSEGYVSVRTPLVFDKKLWETSGHWSHYRDNMFYFPDRWDDGKAQVPAPDHVPGPGADEPTWLGIKAMNCPSHMLIFKAKKHSYRELPLRIHDQGVLHRNELSGAMSGLTRVRQFCQDDAHLFVTEEQIADEVGQLLDLVYRIYPAFDLVPAEINLSTRPADKLGDDALWDQAEGALKQALESRNVSYNVQAGDGAFYGPKIDFQVEDALGRRFQCATIQLDYQLPRRFDLSYVGADNKAHVPVVIHRAIFGSFERFIGMLIEHYAGAFPVWLAPEQVRVLTVSEKSLEHGGKVAAALKAAGIRHSFDDSDEKIGYKIRVGANYKIPYLLVLGEREGQEGTVSVRARGNQDLGTMSLDAFVQKVKDESKIPF